MTQTAKLKKSQFLKDLATPATKKHATTTTVLTILCIALMFFSLYLSYITPVEELPVIESLLDLVDGHSAVTDLKAELKSAAASFTQTLAHPDETITPETAAYFTSISNAMITLANELSLENMQKFSAQFANIPAELTELLGEEAIAVALLLESIVNAIVIGVAVALAFPMLFLALGGFCRNTALAVIGMILSIGITLALFMTPLFLLYQLMQILLIVFTSKVNKAYKAYKRAPIIPEIPVESAPAAE